MQRYFSNPTWHIRGIFEVPPTFFQDFIRNFHFMSSSSFFRGFPLKIRHAHVNQTVCTQARLVSFVWSPCRRNFLEFWARFVHPLGGWMVKVSNVLKAFLLCYESFESFAICRILQPVSLRVGKTTRWRFDLLFQRTIFSLNQPFRA